MNFLIDHKKNVTQKINISFPAYFKKSNQYGATEHIACVSENVCLRVTFIGGRATGQNVKIMLSVDDFVEWDESDHAQFKAAWLMANFDLLHLAPKY